MEDILGVLLIFGGGTLVALAMSPIGRAVAARIQGHGPGMDPDELRRLRESHDEMTTELEAVRQDIVELQERVDFTERVLARKRDEPSLPAGQ